MAKAAAGKTPELEARSSASRGFDTDLVGVYQDPSRKPATLKGDYASILKRLASEESFSARVGAVQFIRFGGKKPANHVALAGLGPASEATEEKLRLAGGHAWSKLSSEKARNITVHADTLIASPGSNADPLRLILAFAEGLALSAYEFTKYKQAGARAKPSDYKGPESVAFVSKDKSLIASLRAELPRVVAAAEAVHLTRDWSNEPSNMGTPEFYASEARRLARESGLTVKVLTESDAVREKMGLFVGVGQGSTREGRIVVIEYRPKNPKSAKTIAFVGKGVTFDSGGISIKPSLRMEDMKHDMTGAATIMGAVLLASRWKVPNRVIAVLAFTENMPDGSAIQPGNILTSRAGKTVEIINTDAEGRLVLADVLDYAQDMKPDAVIDVATLTGAVSVALGKICCGLMGNDDRMIAAIRRSAEIHGERAWQLPLFDEYLDDLRSEHADIKNSANDALGGAIRGAIFLKQFIRKGTAWAHLDIASTGANVPHLSYCPKKGASGLFVRTLAQFAADF